MYYENQDLQRRHDNLVAVNRSLRERLYELSTKLIDAQEKNEQYESKIIHELNPRIKAEQDRYDSYVISGGSDQCFRSGMSGDCNFSCRAFGSKTECYERIETDEDTQSLIDAYEDGEVDDVIYEYFESDKVKNSKWIEKLNTIKKRNILSDIALKNEQIDKLITKYKAIGRD